MKIREFRDELWLPRPREEVFPFFADAANLEKITPEFLRFEIITPEAVAMRVGTLIDYRLRIHGVPIRWRTEIIAWEPPRFFVDRQLRGPYRLWEHEHRFEEKNGGTLASDLVRYAVSGGVLGDIANRLFVARDVARIFSYRQEKLRSLFGGITGSVAG